MTHEELDFIQATARADLAWIMPVTWIERLDAIQVYRHAEDALTGYLPEEVRDLRERGHVHMQWLRRARRGVRRG